MSIDREERKKWNDEQWKSFQKQFDELIKRTELLSKKDNMAIKEKNDYLLDGEAFIQSMIKRERQKHMSDVEKKEDDMTPEQKRKSFTKKLDELIYKYSSGFTEDTGVMKNPELLSQKNMTIFDKEERKKWNDEQWKSFQKQLDEHIKRTELLSKKNNMTVKEKNDYLLDGEAFIQSMIKRERQKHMSDSEKWEDDMTPVPSEIRGGSKPRLSIFEENPEEYLDMPVEKWIFILSKGYYTFPPDTPPVFKSDFSNEEELIQYNRDLWKKYRRQLVKQKQLQEDFETSQKLQHELEVKRINLENKKKLVKEQESKLKEFIKLHQKGLITKETLTNLQTELLSTKLK